MILFRFGERPFPGSPHYSAIGRSIRLARDGLRVCHELRDLKTGEWLQRDDSIMGIAVVPPEHGAPSRGVRHVWHDGPHCNLWIGRLVIHWSGNPWTGKCKRCQEEAGGLPWPRCRGTGHRCGCGRFIGSNQRRDVPTRGMATWHPAHPESSTPATVATLELAEIEADVEVYGDRSVLVWRWSHDGRIVGVTEAGEA